MSGRPPDTSPVATAIRCKCPKCGTGNLYPSRYSLTLNDDCAACGLELSRNDSADGPAVFLIFALGAILVPLALFFETAFAPPLLVHVLLWGSLALIMTLYALRPLKAYVLALQYKHRPEDWER